MEPTFDPTPGAYGFQLSNPPVLSMASIHVALAVAAAAGGLPCLRAKSVMLTGYLSH